MEAQREMFITPEIRTEIIKIVDERIKEAHVTKEDFSELKAIVRQIAASVQELSKAQSELAEAQKRTEAKVEQLAEAQKRTEAKVEQLAEAQKRTEARVEQLAKAQAELAEAQKRTEAKVEQLAEAQRKTEEEVRALAIGLNQLREHVGGLDRSFGYAFENEAYRMLPKFLKERHGIEVKDRFIRAEIGGKEVNFFAKAERNGKEIYIVGEAKTRLDNRKKEKDPFKELEEKVAAVKSEYGEDIEIVRLLVTHFARKGFLKKAEAKNVMVVQSYEW